MNNIIYIEKLEEEISRVYNTLNENQLKRINEPDLGLFIAESPKVIVRALDAGYEPVSMVAEEHLLNGEIRPILDRLGQIPIYVSCEEVLTCITGYKLTRGVLCAMKRKRLKTVSELCENAGRIAVLEDVENPTNVGAIIRSAAALKIDAVILTRGCCDPLYRRAIRVSMGNVFLVPWTFFGEHKQDWHEGGIEYLHNLGFKTVAMALSEKSIAIDSPGLNGIDKMAILMGTEGEGLCRETLERSDFVARIPMSMGVDSLNVAAASAVAFWQLAAGNH
ncbi:MAG: RNA methyltransferase [Butyrivibrio sp.]|nr:RNA methyltransferase [Butyrivibrio sp.]